MRHITGKDYTNPPKALVKKNAIKKIDKVFQQRDGNLYSGHYYKDADVKKELIKYSLKVSKVDQKADPKCFYCESTSEVGAKLQVEHYRPKAKVDKKDTDGIDHNGYFHLGLEWSNLLLSCSICNGVNGKGTRFPILYNRVDQHNPVEKNYRLNRLNLLATSSHLSSEGTLLLNPEIENPDNHLTYESDAKIIGKTFKGEKSIEIYNLNRPLLKKARFNVLNELVNSLNIIILSDKQSGGGNPEYFENLILNTCKKFIDDSKNNELTYTQWRKFIIRHFIITVLVKLDRNYIVRVYKIFKTVRGK